MAREDRSAISICPYCAETIRRSNASFKQSFTRSSACDRVSRLETHSRVRVTVHVIVLIAALAIRGEIAGFGVLPNGDGHAFLLVPCDEMHPHVEGCDYNMMEASATASVKPTIYATPGTPGRRLPIALWRHGNRFHFPRPVIGQTN
jgi:hypothetical protein